MKIRGLIFLLLTATIGWAQQDEHHERMQQSESARVAMLTTELSLTTDEAQRFWPIYNEMRNQIQEIMRKRHDEMTKLRENNALSAAEKETIVIGHYQSEQDLSSLRLEYHAKFKETIGLEKTILLFEAERKFQRQMMQRYKKRGERMKRNN